MVKLKEGGRNMENYSHKYKISPELTLYGAYWGVKKPRANVLVITGMQEHAMRYTEFAKFLNEAEFSVYSIDYFGQGENVTQGGHTLGVLPNHGFEKFVTALGTFVENLAKDKLPLYVLGHSMGSFLAQRFVQRYPLLSKKVVIVGSNGPSALFGMGKAIAALTVNNRNRDKESKLLASMAIGAYSKAVKNAHTPADWLSYNEDNVNTYLAHPLDGKPSSKGFYLELLRGTSNLYKKKHYVDVPRDLPIFIIAGAEDPVGANGKGIIKLGKFYAKLGFTNLEVKIYEGMRHEILNETDRRDVYADVLSFLMR